MQRIYWLKAFFVLMAMIMVYLVVDTSIKSNLFTLQINEPWFTTTLFDFYFNIAIISAWVIYKERNALYRILWVISFVLLGSIATCLYVAFQLCKLKPGDSLDKILVRNAV